MARLGALNTGTDITAGGGGSGATQALMETRTLAAAATIDVAVKSLRTAGYASPGDSGHGLYKRLQSAPTAPTNKAYFRSIDRVKADGTTDATNGGYWELVPEGGEVRIEQFGGKADTTTGLNGTDNYQPLRDAIEITGWSSNPSIRYSYAIKFGVGRYRISQTVELHEIVHIKGVGSGIDAQGSGFNTALYFPPNTTGFIIHRNDTGPGPAGTSFGGGESSGSTLESFSIHGSGTDLDKAGVLMRGQATLRQLGIYDAPGKGILIRASVSGSGQDYGNANNWKIYDCLVNSCTSNALHVEGSDTNGGVCSGFISHGIVGGCGIFEASYIGGNSYNGVQISGYGNAGVSHGGNRYQLLSANPVTAAATTPGTNNQVWYFLTAGGPIVGYYPAWNPADATQHVLKAPIWTGGTSSSFIAPYYETAAGLLMHIPPPGMVYGGPSGVTRYSGGFLCNGTGGAQGGARSYTPIQSGVAFVTGSAEYTQNGEETWVAIGGPDEDNFYGSGGGLTLMSHRRFRDNVNSWKWGYRGNDIRYSGAGRILWDMTTVSTTMTFGRSVIQPGYIQLHDPVLRNPNDLLDSRVLGIRSNRSQLPTDAASGEFYHEIYAAGWGALGWVCTAPHATAPTWHSVPVFGLTSATPQYNGHLVVECTSNTSLTFKYKGSDGVVRSATLTLA